MSRADIHFMAFVDLLQNHLKQPNVLDKVPLCKALHERTRACPNIKKYHDSQKKWAFDTYKHHSHKIWTLVLVKVCVKCESMQVFYQICCYDAYDQFFLFPLQGLGVVLWYRKGVLTLWSELFAWLRGITRSREYYIFWWSHFYYLTQNLVF